MTQSARALTDIGGSDHIAAMNTQRVPYPADDRGWGRE
jgi:hypothetical protein